MRKAPLFLSILLLSSPLGANQQQDDDELLAKTLLKPPSAQGLVAHPIANFGHCDFFASRGERWKQSFADGSSISVRCEPEQGHFLPGFHVWFADAVGKRVEIARCIFDEGFNRGWYYTPAETDTSGRYLYTARVVWRNIDGGKDDHGSRRIDKDHTTGAAEPFVDIVFWVFDPAIRSLECISEKHLYAAQTAKGGLPSGPGSQLQPYIGAAVPSLTQSFVKVFGY